MNSIKELGATVAQVKQCYNTRFCISNEAEFQKVKSKVAVKNIITSVENDNAGSVLGFNNGLLTLLIQIDKKTFNISTIGINGEIMSSWTESTISKAMSRLDGIKDYFVSANSVLRMSNTSVDSKLVDLSIQKKQQLVYKLSNNVNSILSDDFKLHIDKLKATIDNNISDGEYIKANKLLKKLLNDNNYYSSSSDREIELTDLIDLSCSQRISTRIENEINLSSWYDKLSSDGEIRAEAAKVLRLLKSKSREYFTV